MVNNTALEQKNVLNHAQMLSNDSNGNSYSNITLERPCLFELQHANKLVKFLIKLKIFLDNLVILRMAHLFGPKVRKA